MPATTAVASNKNVIIFGESGSGKSSIVNLLLQQNRAKVSDKAVGCTFNFQKYATPNFNLYDTVGLSEGAEGTVKQEFAVTELINLLKSLEDGVSLLIFVIEKGRIKKSLNDNYKLFVDTLCMKKVPVVLVITHCEMETILGVWFEENKIHFDKYGMTFDAVISGSALQPHTAPAMMQSMIKDLNVRTMTDLLSAISVNLMTTAWKMEGGWKNWFYAICKGIVKVVGRVIISSSNVLQSNKKVFENELINYFQSQGYSSDQSAEMSQHIANEMTEG